MKTVSKNTPTIYSATTPENNPPQLVASLVPDEQRISFWPQHFGLIPLLRWYLESVHPEQRRGIYGTRTG